MAKKQQESPAAALVLLLVVVAAAVLLCSPAVVSARKVGETCALDRNCDAGLHCETCVHGQRQRPPALHPRRPRRPADQGTEPCTKACMTTDRVIHPNLGSLDSRLATFFLAGLEVIRRGHWNFYRLENEHLNNAGKFRAVKTVPLPFREVDVD